MCKTFEISKLNLLIKTKAKPGLNNIKNVLEISTRGHTNIDLITPENINILEANKAWNKKVKKPKNMCNIPRSNAKLDACPLTESEKLKTWKIYCTSKSPK